jgi:hypothetical protein
VATRTAEGLRMDNHHRKLLVFPSGAPVLAYANLS